MGSAGKKNCEVAGIVIMVSNASKTGILNKMDAGYMVKTNNQTKERNPQCKISPFMNL